MFISEAEEIVLMSKLAHASAKAGQFSQNFRNVLCSLIRGLRLRVFRKVGRRHCGDESLAGLRELFAGAADEYPGNQAEEAYRRQRKPYGAFVFLSLLFWFQMNSPFIRQSPSVENDVDYNETQRPDQNQHSWAIH